MLIAFVISTTIIVSLLIWCIAIIWKKSVHQGQISPTKPLRWFLDIFKDGMSIIRRCLWILFIPLITEMLKSSWYLLHRHLYLSRALERFEASKLIDLGGFMQILKQLPRILPFAFFNAAGSLNLAILSSHSYPFITIVCLITFGYAFYRSIKSYNVDKSAWGRWLLLSILSGIIGVGLLIFNIQIMRSTIALKYSFWWIAFIYTLPGLIIQAFIAAIILALIRFTANGEKRPFSTITLQAKKYFRPLFFFGAIILFLKFLPLLPLSLPTKSQIPHLPNWLLYGIPGGFASILLALISFVPIIVVTDKITNIEHALKACFNFLALNIRNVLVFIGIVAVVMLIPIVFKGRIHWIFPSWSCIRTIVSLLIVGVKVTISAIAIASMMVFYDRTRRA